MKQTILYQSLLAVIIFILMRCLDNTFGYLIELLVKMLLDFDSALIMSYDWYNAGSLFFLHFVLVIIYTNKNINFLKPE